MSTRIPPIDAVKFTHLFFSLVLASEGRDDLPDDDEIYRFALRELKGDEEAAGAFLVRFENFWEMMSSEEANDHLGGDDESIKFHPAVLEAAATLRTRHNGSFPQRQFFSKVAELKAGKFADFEFSPPE